MRPVRRVSLYLLGSSALAVTLLAALFSMHLTASAAPAPPRTPTPSRCGVCQLSVSSVTITCNSDGSVGWTATLYNGGTCSVTAGWDTPLPVHPPPHPPRPHPNGGPPPRLPPLLSPAS